MTLLNHARFNEIHVHPVSMCCVDDLTPWTCTHWDEHNPWCCWQSRLHNKKVNCCDCQCYVNALSHLHCLYVVGFVGLCSRDVQPHCALVFMCREQALLPPDQKPLGSCGHINQLWPRSAPLWERSGLARGGFPPPPVSVSVCVRLLPL